MSDRDGKSAATTLGIVSPMITQKATMPPKALQGDQLAPSLTGASIPTYNAHWAMEIAMSPEAPKQCCTVLLNVSYLKTCS